MQRHERGSREARLATVSLGLITITLIFAAAIVVVLGAAYRGIGLFNQEVEGVNYTFSDYISDVGGLAAIAIAITVIAAVVLYFVYVRVLDRMSDTPE